MRAYAELAVTTNFSFLRGASHPQEMVAAADELGLAAIGIADRNSFAGVVRAHAEAKKRTSIKLLVGTRLVTEDGFETLAYPTDRDAYGRLCRLLTQGNRAAKKGECRFGFEAILEAREGQIFVVMPPDDLAIEPCSHGALFLLPLAGEGASTKSRRMREGSALPPPKRSRFGFASAEAGRHQHPHPSPLRGDTFSRKREKERARPMLPRSYAAPPAQVETFTERLACLAREAPGRVFLAGVHRHRGDEPRRLGLLAELGKRLGAPLVAVNDVHYHAPGRRKLADIVTCVREKCTLADAGLRLTVNAERHLKPPHEMARLFAGFEEAIARGMRIATACHFSLDELRYEYPDEPVPPGKTADQHLRDLALDGLARRYPKDRFPLGIPEDVRKTLMEELSLIAKLGFAHYFLTVHDVVVFARKRGILCQGRGSAANSAVCYCLGITEVDPSVIKLLFARFISERRGEPPDIDVDFEHERREEVIQHLYDRYGRERAAICATVIHYRSRRAIREVGKVLGLTPDVTAALAKTVWGSDSQAIAEDHICQIGLDPSNPAIRQAVELAAELIGFPRHLSQHVGGFVLTRKRLDETVPVGNAAMEDRTFIEWDKDDIDMIGLMKVDVLALGMLSCIRSGLDLLKRHYGLNDISLASVLQNEPRDDPKVYEMLSRADSVGVFQVESRAQMSMLPRLSPKRFYDLVIEVAIVRPGPIQGDMVHPYLRRRDGSEEAHYPSPDPAHGPVDELEEVLKRTLGVPLFQEQAMQIAITAAKFSPDEADGLRRAMATFRHTGTIHLYREKFISGMVGRGYDRDFAQSCFNQIEGFGEYGFPESHAASFALLVYVSAWIKCHYPEAFCAAILNSQPMGFYQPAQLVRDACRHEVEVREADVNFSEWDCTLEPARDPSQRPFAVRLGFRQIQGLRQEEIKSLVTARGNGYASLERLGAVSGVSHFTIERLAEADAFRSLGFDRREALWTARRLSSIGIEKGVISSSASVPTHFRQGRSGGTMTRATSPLAGEVDGEPSEPSGEGYLKTRTTPHPDYDLSGRNPTSPARGEVTRAAVAPHSAIAKLASSGRARPAHHRSAEIGRRDAAPPLSAEKPLPLFAPHLCEELFPEEPIALPKMPLNEHVVEDYVTTGLSLKAHPVSFLRERLAQLGAMRNAEHRSESLPQDARVTVAGLVLMRQMPGTAKGVVFMTLEDETDIANIIVWPKAFARNRITVMTARLLAVRGRLQRAGLVVHVVAEGFIDLTAELRRLSDGGDPAGAPEEAPPSGQDLPLLKSRDFH